MSRLLTLTATLTMLLLAMASLADPAGFAGSPGPLAIAGTVTPPDCNGNGIDDASDIASGFSRDTNRNAVPDECDIEAHIAQVSWPDGAGGYIAAHSDWGRVALRFDPSDLPLLFVHPSGGHFGWVNLATAVPGGRHANWAVQNFYVHFDGPGETQTALPAGVFFSLTTPTGTRVNQLDYAISISAQPLSDPPSGPWRLGVAVGQRDELWGCVESRGNSKPPSSGSTADSVINPAHNYIGLPLLTVLTDETVKVRFPEIEIPAVDEDINGCVPAGVARSLAYLDLINPTISLKDGDDILTADRMYDILKGPGYMGSSLGKGGTGTVLDKGISGKERFVKERQKSGEIEGHINTRKLNCGNIAEVVKAMENRADVEINYHPGGQMTVSHFAFVSSITVHRDSKNKVTGFTVTTLDDTQGDGVAQNNKNTLTFDKDGRLVGGPANAQCLTFVVEEYKPAKK